MNQKSNHYFCKGMMLIELLVVIVLVGILASIAVSSYRSHVIEVKTKRAASQAQLLALRMERLYSENGSYLGASTDIENNDYDLKIVLDHKRPHEFRVEAIPKKSNKDLYSRGKFVINHLGKRSWEKVGGISTN